MARRRRPEKREILPDPKFGDIVLSKFMNSVMLDGKKSVAEQIVYGALESVETRLKKDPIQVFHDALNNVKPGIEVRSRRVGGATYQVPVQIEGPRRQSLAMRWLLLSARSRPGKSMEEKLANELLDAFNNTGATIKRREDTHRMAEANRAFSHYGRF
jgi:small subunit ribosomal protein S7